MKNDEDDGDDDDDEKGAQHQKQWLQWHCSWCARGTRHTALFNFEVCKMRKKHTNFFFCFYPTNNFHCTICVRRRGLCVMCIWCAVRELMMFNQKLLRSSIEHTCYIYRRYILMMMSTMMMGVVERTRPIPSINRFVFIHCVCVRKIHQKWKCIRLRLFHLFFFFSYFVKTKRRWKKIQSNLC